MLLNLLDCPLSLNWDTSDYIAAFAAAVALFSLWRSERLTKTAFNRNYRPYIFAEKVVQVNPDGKRMLIPYLLTLTATNAPALVNKATVTYYIRVAGQKDELRYEFIGAENLIIYPLADVRSELRADHYKAGYENLDKLSESGQVIRKLRIDYGWISDNDDINYFFEAEWKYNGSSSSQQWEPLYHKAN